MTFRGSKKLPLEGWGCLVERASLLLVRLPSALPSSTSTRYPSPSRPRSWKPAHTPSRSRLPIPLPLATTLLNLRSRRSLGSSRANRTRTRKLWTSSSARLRLPPRRLSCLRSLPSSSLCRRRILRSWPRSLLFDGPRSSCRFSLSGGGLSRPSSSSSD